MLPFDKIESIELKQTLPSVFADMKPDSEVWLTDLSLAREHYYIIEAESGTGKSSLCAYLYGSRCDFLGDIFFNGVDISTFTVAQWQEIRRCHLAYLPQELDLFPELSAFQNIKLKNNLTGFVDDAQIRQWLDMIGLADRKDFPVGKMSIGQQQRVAIVRAICQPFDFIILDEPVSHLDVRNNEIAAELISQIARKNNAAIIATSVGNQLMFDAHSMLKL